MDKKYQKKRIPHYIKDFTCIGAACEDSCCVGWYIAIDEETYKKYKKVKDKAIKGRLEKEIVRKRTHPTVEHAAKIKLKNGRCAFLSDEGLCDIYSILGKAYLSHTCTLYPRTINRINDTLEYSLICSCPEAARLILLSKEQIKFCDIEQEETVPTISADLKVNHLKPEKWQDYFFELRAFIIDVLQNRNYTIEDRMKLMGSFMREFEKYILHHTTKKIPDLIVSYNKAILSHKIDHYIKGYESDTKEAIDLIQALQAFSTSKKIKSKRYQQCLEEMFLGLQLGEVGDLKKVSQLYDVGYTKYYKHFIKENGYMVENYLANYVFERCMPLDHKQPFESFRRMDLYYKLVKLHVIGMTSYSEHFTKEDFIRLIQSLSKTFDHDDESLETLLAIKRNKQ